MKLPRDVGGSDLAAGLTRVGYAITRQTGSHIRLTLQQEPQHHITIPAHDALKIGTLAAVLGEVGSRLNLSKAELLERLRL